MESQNGFRNGIWKCVKPREFAGLECVYQVMKRVSANVQGSRVIYLRIFDCRKKLESQEMKGLGATQYLQKSKNASIHNYLVKFKYSF